MSPTQSDANGRIQASSRLMVAVLPYRALPLIGLATASSFSCADIVTLEQLLWALTSASRRKGHKLT
jgi:hypothetical protein